MPSSDHVAELPVVHSLDRFAILVPDIAKAQRFFSGFGVGVEENGNGLAVRVAGSKAPSGLIFESDSKKLHHLSFGIYEANADAFTAHLQQMRIARLDPPG